MSVKHATSSRLDYRFPRMGPSHETGHGGGGGRCHAPCAPAKRAHARKVRVCFISASIVSAISTYRAGPGRDSHIMHNTQVICIHILAYNAVRSLTRRAILLVISPSYQFIRAHGSVDHSIDIRLTLPQQGQLELTHGSPSAAPVPIVRDRGRGKPSPGATQLKS